MEIPPESSNTQMDVEFLKSIWSKTIGDVIKGLSSITPSRSIKRIYWFDEQDGTHYADVEVPKYVCSDFKKLVHEKGKIFGKELIDYLWDCGKPKKELFSDDPAFSKSNWIFLVIHELIAGPIISMLDDCTIYQCVDNQGIIPWFITNEQLEDYVSKASRALINGKVIIQVCCPIFGIKLNGLQHAEISKHITFKNLTSREKSIFLSKYSREFCNEHFPLVSCHTMAELEFDLDINEVSREKVISLIADELDLIKLGVLLWKDKTGPIIEGKIVIDIIGRDYLDIPMSFTRYSDPFAALSELELSVEELPILIDIVRILYEQQQKETNIKNAITYFGRACLVPLYRDVLFESAIGLDGLLVPGGGDSRIRFCLYGAILLADKTITNLSLFETLKVIYGLRSGAAHGEKEGKDQIALNRNAVDARKYLARAIYNISRLCHKGLLPIKNENGKALGLNESLQRLIITKSSSISDWIERQY